MALKYFMLARMTLGGIPRLRQLSTMWLANLDFKPKSLATLVDPPFALIKAACLCIVFIIVKSLPNLNKKIK